jgi:hypothetical protein
MRPECTTSDGKSQPLWRPVPAGRSTGYSWQSTDAMLTIDEELANPEAAGFLSMFWYEIAAK